MSKRLIACASTALLVGASLVASPAVVAGAARESGIDRSGFDASTRPQDDFNRYANGGWIDKTAIPADKATWGSFAILREESDKHITRLTCAPTNVIDFGVSPDGASLTYTSDGALWLQSNAPDAAAAQIVDLSGTDPAHPVFSPNGNQVAYADNGIWVMSIQAGNRRQYTSNEFASDMGVYTRYFEPRHFTANGWALIVNIGVWEGETVAVLDLSSGDLDELENLIHTDALPLADGRLLIYGNTPVAGEFNLQITGDSLQNTRSCASAKNSFAVKANCRLQCRRTPWPMAEGFGFALGR